MFNQSSIFNMVKFTRILFGSVLISSLGFQMAKAQCPVADFSISQPVCPQQFINITNNSTGVGLSSSWDFCAGDFFTGVVNNFDTVTPVTTASYAVSVVDGANHYGFICGRTDDKLVRLDFGNSFLDTPTIVDLGNPLGTFSSPNGLVFHQEGGIWYAVEISIFNNTAALFTFGNGLNNPPTASSPITIAGLNWPRSIALSVEGGHVFTAMMNNLDDKLVIADYGLSITNASPTVNSYSVTGAGGGRGVSIARTCNVTCVFVASANTNSLIRVDFGNSLQNAPTGVTPLNYSFASPSGVSVITDDGKWLAVVSSYGVPFVTVVSLDTGLTNNNPVLVNTYSLPNNTLAGLTTVKDNSDWYISFIDETYEKFFSIHPLNACSANPPVSTDPVPANVQYNLDGTYHIALQVEDASGNFSFFADSVNIAPAPVVSFSFQNLCEGDIVQFTDSSTLSAGTITGRHWDFGDGDTSNAVNPTHQYAGANSYTVTLILTASSGCATSLTQTVTISATPVASFVLPNGCSDALLSFTDQSTISSGSISDWLWNFGNGDTTSIQNPFYGFPDGGSFDVTLQVTSAFGCSDDTTFSLNISPSPDAAFATSNTCVGQTITFTDQTVSQVNITTYSWDFGDGGTSPLSNPTYTYVTGVPATFNVTFIVQSANLCSDTVIIPLHVSNPPTANFSYSPANACENNNVAFTDLSTGNGDTISAWSWDFDDGSTDSIFNPSHVFGASDTFHVTLIAYSPSNCPSAPYTQDIIVLQSPIASFSYSEVCLGDPIPFTDLSVAPNGSSIIDRMWRFDGIDSSQQTNPSYLFTTDGLHNVILTVTTNFGCTSSDTVNVAVHAHPQAAFVYQNACTDFPTLFTSNSTADSASYIATYEWNFGDPGSPDNISSLQNPSHLYDSASVGIHNVFLIVTNNFGCRDSVIQTLDVNFSVIPNFTYSPTCLGDVMSFTNFSQNANLDSTWSWNFGDQQTISIANPAHYYVFAGTYTVTLTALSVDGCLSSSTKDVVVSGIPVANFATPPACIHSPYQLTDNSTVSNGSITRWDWTIDTLTSDTLQNPVFTFDTTGTYSVNLIVYSDIGCIDSVRKNVTVHPLPVPNFSYTPQYGNPPLDVTFTNLTDILAQSTFTWSFGDNTSGSTLQAPHHIYQDTGRYVIQMVATSDFGCVDSISKGIYVIKPILDAAVTNVSASLVNNQLSIQASIANLGTVDIDSVIMQAQLQDGTVIQEVYHQLLPNGSNGIQSYDFVARFNIPPSSPVEFYCVSVIKPNGKNDDVQSNNEKCSSLTNEFSVMEPFPNPFTDQLQMNVILPYEDYLTVEMYNSLGQKLSTIFDGAGTTGLNLIHSDLTSLADGVYTLRFSFREQDILRKVIKSSNKKD